MTGWKDLTLAEARADGHARLRREAAEVHRYARTVRQLNERAHAAKKEAEDASMALYRKADALHALRTNVEYLDQLPDDASPGDPPGTVTPERQAEILAGIQDDEENQP